MQSRIEPLNRSAAFTPLQFAKVLWHRKLKRRERRAPAVGFIESSLFHLDLLTAHEPAQIQYRHNVKTREQRPPLLGERAGVRGQASGL